MKITLKTYWISYHTKCIGVTIDVVIKCYANANFYHEWTLKELLCRLRIYHWSVLYIRVWCERPGFKVIRSSTISICIGNSMINLSRIKNINKYPYIDILSTVTFACFCYRIFLRIYRQMCLCIRFNTIPSTKSTPSSTEHSKCILQPEITKCASQL